MVWPKTRTMAVDVLRYDVRSIYWVKQESKLIGTNLEILIRECSVKGLNLGCGNVTGVYI